MTSTMLSLTTCCSCLYTTGLDYSGGRLATSDATSAGRSTSSSRWPARSASRSAGTFHTASATIASVILLEPAVRSSNVIGTSTHPSAHPQRPVGELDLEHVALAVHGVEVGALEHPPVEALEPAGEVADGDAEQGARIERAGPRDQAPVRRPPDHAAAGDIARAEHEIGVGRGLEQARQRRSAGGDMSASISRMWL